MFALAVGSAKGGPWRVASGTVKWFSEEKGYGFIEPDEGDEEIFVHYTDVEGEGFQEPYGRCAGVLRGHQ